MMEKYTLKKIKTRDKIAIGQHYRHENSIYVLCSVSHSSVGLIDIISGTRWSEPVRVDNAYDIPEYILRKIFDNGLLNKVYIEIEEN